MIVSYIELKGIAAEILARAGASSANADCVAAHLANDLWQKLLGLAAHDAQATTASTRGWASR